jgi:hypothetical protein
MHSNCEKKTMTYNTFLNSTFKLTLIGVSALVFYSSTIILRCDKIREIAPLPHGIDGKSSQLTEKNDVVDSAFFETFCHKDK